MEAAAAAAAAAAELPVLRIDEEELLRRRPSDCTQESAPLPVSSRLGMRRERCASCGQPVFLAEKLVVARSVYHRSCFRCARCRNQLTPGNYYETEEGQYCCEACPVDDEVDLDAHEPVHVHPQPTSPREPPDQQQPQQPQQPRDDDEEAPVVATAVLDAAVEPTQELLAAPLSDEEKTKRRSLERSRSLERLLHEQRGMLERATAHLLEDRPDEAKPQDKPQSDEEKLATEQQLRQQQRPPEESADLKFDRMIHLLNQRIDELSIEGVAKVEADEAPTEQSEEQPPDSPPPRRMPRRLSLGAGERRQQEPVPGLRRSSSLRGARALNPPPVREPPPRPPPLIHLPPPPPPPSPPPPTTDYPEELNPFASDEEDKLAASATPDAPATPAASVTRVPSNPFGSSEEEPEEEIPRPAARSRVARRLLEAPRISLTPSNPFWSDDEEPESDAEVELRSKSPPVPRPRTLRHSHLEPRSNLRCSSLHSSNASIASSCSTVTPGGTYRKKKPAPPPPPLIPGSPTRSSGPVSLSPRLTPRTRKSKPAPPPPLPTSPPPDLDDGPLPVVAPAVAPAGPPTPPPPTYPAPERLQQRVWDEEKLTKDEANRNTQSLSSSDTCAYLPYPADKSVEGKWKRKKGPAPARPTPLRRKVSFLLSLKKKLF